MFSFRYHIASLSAVFIALDRSASSSASASPGAGSSTSPSAGTSRAESPRSRTRWPRLNAEKSLARTSSGQAAQSFVEDTYPALMANRLAHRRIAVIVIGSNAAAAGADVAQTLSDAGASTAFYRAFKEPVTLRPLLQSLHGLAGFRNLPDIAYELAQEWVTRGASPVADRVAPLVVDEQRGAAFRPVDGVVIVERRTGTGCGDRALRRRPRSGARGHRRSRRRGRAHLRRPVGRPAMAKGGRPVDRRRPRHVSGQARAGAAARRGQSPAATASSRARTPCCRSSRRPVDRAGADHDPRRRARRGGAGSGRRSSAARAVPGTRP